MPAETIGEVILYILGIVIASLLILDIIYPLKNILIFLKGVRLFLYLLYCSTLKEYGNDLYFIYNGKKLSDKCFRSIREFVESKCHYDSTKQSFYIGMPNKSKYISLLKLTVDFCDYKERLKKL